MRNQRKEAIKKAFSLSARTYETQAVFQKETARELVGLIPRGQKFHTIVDAGCGTGLLTELLLERFPGTTILCFDIALPMVERLKEKLGTAVIPFGADCEVLPLKDCGVDLLVSNLTYQWMEDPLRAFSEAWRVLKNRGYFVFSTLGNETFRELKSSVKKAVALTGKDGLPPFVEFKDARELKDLLLKAGFSRVYLKRTLKRRSYEDLWQFLKVLKHTGATNPCRDGSRSLSRGILLKEVDRIYRRDFPSSDGKAIVASYELFWVVAVK